MVKIGKIQHDAYQRTYHTDSSGFQEMRHLLLADSLHKIGNDHKEDGEQEIVGHLHMVGIDLKGSEDSRHQQSPQVFAAVSQHHTRNHRRQIGQGPHFPDMSGCNDDKEIAGESPYDGTQSRHPAAEVEGAHQYIEAQQIYKYIPYILRQPKMISLDSLIQRLHTLIRRCHLIGWHSTEECIGPTGHFARAILILRLFLSGTHTGRRIMPIQDLSLYVGRKEISERNHSEEHDDEHFRQNLFERFHYA